MPKAVVLKNKNSWKLFLQMNNNAVLYKM